MNTMMQLMDRAHLKYQPTPLLWIKPSGENHRPYHKFTCNYEAFFFGWKEPDTSVDGFKELNKPHMNTFEKIFFDTSKKEHPEQKHPLLYKEMREISSNKGDTIRDPFMGSGVSLKVAKDMGRKIIGIEYVEEHYDLAKYIIGKEATIIEMEEHDETEVKEKADAPSRSSA